MAVSPSMTLLDLAPREERLGGGCPVTVRLPVA
jgi:hypothetical protein